MLATKGSKNFCVQFPINLWSSAAVFEKHGGPLLYSFFKKFAPNAKIYPTLAPKY